MSRYVTAAQAIMLSQMFGGGGGGGGSRPQLLGYVDQTTTNFPTQRQDGSPIENEDYVLPNTQAEFPFIIQGIKFTNRKDKCSYIGGGNWMLQPGALQFTDETPLKDSSLESFFGGIFQSDVNKELVTLIGKETLSVESKVNIISALNFLWTELQKAGFTFTVKETDTDNVRKLAMKVKDYSGRTLLDKSFDDFILKGRKVAGIDLEDDITEQEVQDAIKDLVAELTNKVIDADKNTIKNLEVDNFKDDAVAKAIRDAANAVDTKLTTEKAVRVELDKVGNKIAYTQSATGFVYTFKLLDKNDNVISSFDVDMPLEEMIIDIEYDNANEQFILTLKDGTKKYIKAEGILRGLVTETAEQTLTNKTLDALENTFKNITGDEFKKQLAADKGKVWRVKSDGTWELAVVKEHEIISTFVGVTPTDYTLYILTEDVTYGGEDYSSGMYLWDAEEGKYKPVASKGGKGFENVEKLSDIPKNKVNVEQFYHLTKEEKQGDKILYPIGWYYATIVNDNVVWNKLLEERFKELLDIIDTKVSKEYKIVEDFFEVQKGTPFYPDGGEPVYLKDLDGSQAADYQEYLEELTKLIDGNEVTVSVKVPYSKDEIASIVRFSKDEDKLPSFLLSNPARYCKVVKEENGRLTFKYCTPEYFFNPNEIIIADDDGILVASGKTLDQIGLKGLNVARTLPPIPSIDISDPNNLTWLYIGDTDVYTKGQIYVIDPIGLVYKPSYDFSLYYKKSEIDTFLNLKQDKLTAGESIYLSSTGLIKVENVKYDTNVINKPTIDSYEITGDKTHEDYGLVSEDDFVELTEGFIPKEDGVQVVLPQETTDQPIEVSEINDSEEMKYSELHTSSNKHINTELDNLKKNLADYIGYFNTKQALLDYVGTLSNNDYAIVGQDETHDNECWRYIYNADDGVWEEQYKINNTPMTQAQLDATNSGITSAKVTKYDGYDGENWAVSKLASKCEKGIQVSDNKLGHTNNITPPSTGSRFICGILDNEGHFKGTPTGFQYSDVYNSSLENCLFTRKGANNLYKECKNDWNYVGILSSSHGSTLNVKDDWKELLIVMRISEGSLYYNLTNVIPKYGFTQGSPNGNQTFAGFFWNESFNAKVRLGLEGSGDNRNLKLNYSNAVGWGINGLYIYKR